MSVVVDSSVFQWRMNQLAAAVPRELAPLVLHEEAKQFVRKIVSFLPPKSLQQGRNAVAADIGKLAYILDPRHTRDPRLAEMLRGGDKEKIRQFVNRTSREMRGLPLVDFSPELHRSRRNRRGKVVGHKTVVTTANSLIGLSESEGGKKRITGPYPKTIQQRVGFLKSGYVRAARKLGVTLPNFVMRHPQIGQGAIHEGFGKLSGLNHVTIINRAGRYPEHIDKVRAALKSRANAMRTKTLQLLRGKAVNLGFKRIG